jgi:hypothetical protein
MPKLGEYRYLLDNVAFVHDTYELAAKGAKAGGTGFFVAVPSRVAPDHLHHIYLVTNFHVARNEARTLRVNMRDGKVDLIPVHDWVSTPGGPDIAIAVVSLDPKRHLVEALRSDSFLLTADECQRQGIDAGDDVFMVGRFVDYDGLQTNRPALRFGHISMRGAEVRQPATGYFGPSFVIDMHSRTGFSGSPVFVYRTSGSIFARAGSIAGGGHLLKLLGIHWGQFRERWELKRDTQGEEQPEADLITDGQYVNGLSGMTCVVPAWDILALLDHPRLRDLRDHVERSF